MFFFFLLLTDWLENLKCTVNTYVIQTMVLTATLTNHGVPQKFVKTLCQRQWGA